MEQLLVSLALGVVGGAVSVLCGLKMLQIYQLCSYQAGGFFRWIRRSGGDYPIRYFSLGFFQFISLLIFGFCFPNSRLRYLGLVLHFGLAAYFIFLQNRQKKGQKTPLKTTKRMARLIAAVFVVSAGLCFVSVYFLFDFAVGCALLAAVTVLIPIVVTIAHYIMLPLESLINSHYKKRAKNALASGIIKVGITGSFGKTTAKNILAAMLEKKYRVLSSPASHNTPMGICKLVNGGIEGFDVIIAELGARHKGDIAELCEFIRPHYGIITVTGAQHLETFGDLPTVVRTKLELVKYASEFVVLNSDDERLVSSAGVLKHSLTVGRASDSQGSIGRYLYSGSEGSDARFEDVRVTREGTLFTLVLGSERIDIATKLLGRHVPALFAQCALLASRMGVSLSQIKEAAESILPVEHRLQLIKTNDCTIIDDAYNSNPQGAKNALEVLSLFEGQRIVVTPGFVEMGATQREENKILGKRAAGCADYLFCVGNSDIAKGALEAGMDKSRIFEEESLKNAMERLTALKLNNPTILFLNDLPDNY